MNVFVNSSKETEKLPEFEDEKRTESNDFQDVVLKVDKIFLHERFRQFTHDIGKTEHRVGYTKHIDENINH